MIPDSQLSKVAAGGSDNWVEKTPSRKIVYPLEQVGPFSRYRFNTECLQGMLIHGSGFKELDINSALGCEGCFRMQRMSLPVCGDGVKPKALAPQLYNAGMTGDRGWEFQGSGLGFPLSECL